MTRRVVQLLLVVTFSVVSTSAIAVNISPDSLSGDQMKLLNGEIIVSLSSLPDGVTGVKGTIYIAASPKKVWEVINDYDNHKNFVPNVIDSGILSDNGTEKVMFEKGISGLFIFRKKINIKMKVWGENPKRLYFERIEGDFKVYRGEWLLVDYLLGQGTFLIYKAEVKPDFYAPEFAVRNVQRRECPLMLEAMKKRAESSAIIAEKSK
jgi:ribosome-associated toxin RatA of RatAB toxin-antitoxin module